MTHDARFGLPLSLVEALRDDPSPDAAALAELLAEDEPVCRSRPARKKTAQSWRVGLVGLALFASVGAQAYAATPSLEGCWAMAAARSSFQEKVTGPAPDAATVTVTHDDPDRLAYQLVESREGAEVARGAYDVSFAGAPSISSVGGANRTVTAERDAHGDAVIRAPAVGGLQALIHVRRTGPDTASIEHDVEGAGGSIRVEQISLVRSDAAPK